MGKALKESGWGRRVWFKNHEWNWNCELCTSLQSVDFTVVRKSLMRFQLWRGGYESLCLVYWEGGGSGAMMCDVMGCYVLGLCLGFLKMVCLKYLKYDFCTILR